MWNEARTLSLMQSNISNILGWGPYRPSECTHTHTFSLLQSSYAHKYTLTAGKPPPDTHIEACSKNAVRHKQHQKHSRRHPTERKENERDKGGGGLSEKEKIRCNSKREESGKERSEAGREREGEERD